MYTKCYARVRRLVLHLWPDHPWADDLVQEGVLCCASLRAEFPGQKDAFYLTRCRFRMLDLLRKGSSIDAIKRSGLKELLPPDHSAAVLPQIIHPGPRPDQLAVESNLFDELLLQLRPPETEILRLLRSGSGLRETGRQLHIAHSTMCKNRVHIIQQLRTLEKDLQNY